MESSEIFAIFAGTRCAGCNGSKPRHEAFCSWCFRGTSARPEKLSDASVSMTRTPASLQGLPELVPRTSLSGAAGTGPNRRVVGGRQLSETILLGYEVGTGKEVRVPYAHTVVCGQTQASGKTTTLEGMLSRTTRSLSSNVPRPALAFLTKRAEGAFVAGAFASLPTSAIAPTGNSSNPFWKP